MTHGFFKGLLFLGSGSVIHAVHEEQDMRKMGGLATKIKITYITMLIGSLAIAGIPPLAGFFSKDEILGESLKLGFAWVWLIGFIVAGLTAFYMFRLMGMTFWGQFRGPKAIWDKIHESPAIMTIPLILLAIPSIFLGMSLGLPLGDSRISHWLEPVFAVGTAELGARGGGVRAVRHRRRAHPRERRPSRSSGSSSPGGSSASRSARSGCRRGRSASGSSAARAPFLYRASLNKWWFDDLNHLLFMVIGGRIANALWWFDREVIDGTVNAIGRDTIASGRGLRRIQTGPRPELRARHRDRADRDGRVVPRAGVPMTIDLGTFPILTLVTFLPLLGAVVIALLPASLARPLALVVALATWIASLVLLVAYHPADPGFQFVQTVDWIPIFGIQYKVGADGLAVALVVLTTTLTWISILASFKPIQTRIKEYMIAFLVLEVGLIGVFLALDLFLFYIFWEVVLVPMYLIIGIWGGANRIYATIKFVLYTLVGSLLMLVAILATAYSLPDGAPARGPARSTSRRCASSRMARRAGSRRRSRPGRSSPSSWPSRSRSRCSRSTPGCPTPTRRPRRPAR